MRASWSSDMELLFLSLDFSYKQGILNTSKNLRVSMGFDELNQFGLLEEKIDSLISLVGSLSEKKGDLERNLYSQEKKLSSLTKEVEAFETDRDAIRQRITILLKKINEFEV